MIVTNAHVVNNAKKITVQTHNGLYYKAKVLGADKETDIAVIKIDSDRDFIKFWKFDDVEVGHETIAIGNPFGLAAVTGGIVSAILGPLILHQYIQTTLMGHWKLVAHCLTIKARLLALTLLFIHLLEECWNRFFIPANTAVPIVKRLASGKTIERGIIGVLVAPID